MGLKVLIRGGGEMASGIAHRLHQCHMDVLITEIEHPTAVRRAVAFAEAVYQGYQTVEGVKAVSVSNAEEARAQWAGRNIPLLMRDDLIGVLSVESSPGAGTRIAFSASH